MNNVTEIRDALDSALELLGNALFDQVGRTELRAVYDKVAKACAAFDNWATADIAKLRYKWRAEARRHEEAANEINRSDEDWEEASEEAALHQAEADCLDRCADELAALPPVIPQSETLGG